MSGDTFQHWRQYLLPVRQVQSKPPSWILPGLLPPGMTLLAGDPKTYKSLLVLNMIAAICELIPVGDRPAKRVPKVKGTALYFAAEQTPGRIAHIYQERVIRRKFQRTEGRKVFDFCVIKDPWEWQIDEVDGDKDIVELVNDLKPTLVCIDPLVYFHSIDENDPQLVRPLVPLRKAVLSYGGSLVVVHHARKSGGNEEKNKGTTADFSRVRGTSALWAMADAGIMTTRVGNGAINLTCEFKDFPAHSWTWRPR